jgi:hypothetical protein
MGTRTKILLLEEGEECEVIVHALRLGLEVTTGLMPDPNLERGQRTKETIESCIEQIEDDIWQEGIVKYLRNEAQKLFDHNEKDPWRTTFHQAMSLESAANTLEVILRNGNGPTV